MNPAEVKEKFSDFYDKWIFKLEELLQLLLAVAFVHPTKAEHTRETDLPPDNNHYIALVTKLTTHLKQYYTFKWAAAHQNVFAFFAPVWLTPLENSYMWMTGWKPSMFFKIIQQNQHQFPCLATISEEQLKKIESLRAKISRGQTRVETAMERQQSAIGYPDVTELAKITYEASEGNIDDDTRNKNDGLVAEAMKNIFNALENVMKMGDCLRVKSLKGILDILSPEQGVSFLAAVSMIQIEIRRQGKQQEMSHS